MAEPEKEQGLVSKAMSAAGQVLAGSFDKLTGAELHRRLEEFAGPATTVLVGLHHEMEALKSREAQRARLTWLAVGLGAAGFALGLLAYLRAP